MSRPPRIVVVGAGISGLATAFHLQEALPAASVSVLENQPRVGGALWTERRDGYQVEHGPNGFLGNQASTLRLCQSLGLKEELIEPTTEGQQRFFWHEDRLEPVPAGLRGLLASRLVSFGGLLRLVTERFRRGRGLATLPDESVYQFAERRVGKALAEVFADPVTTDLYAGDPKLLSIRSCFPRVAKAELLHGSVTGGLKRLHKQEQDRARQAGGPEPHARPVLLSFPQGMGRLVDTLQARLKTPPRAETGVKQVSRGGDPDDSWEVLTDRGERLAADAVVLACPAMRQAGMLADLDGDLAEALLSIPYSSVVVVALGYRREHVPGIVESYGVVVPQRHRRDVLGVQFCSSIFRDRAPAGHVLLRAVCGGWHRREMACWEDDLLVTVVRRELRNLLGVTRPPEFMTIARWPKGIPQYTLGHAKRVETIERLAAAHPGLFLAGNAFHGVSVNDCTKQSERVAKKVQDFLARG